ncbi:MAG: hypothetical protein ACYCZX_16225 [Rhodospirillaceae bacterium]
MLPPVSSWLGAFPGAPFKTLMFKAGRRMENAPKKSLSERKQGEGTKTPPRQKEASKKTGQRALTAALPRQVS